MVREDASEIIFEEYQEQDLEGRQQEPQRHSNSPLNEHKEPFEALVLGDQSFPAHSAAAAEEGHQNELAVEIDCRAKVENPHDESIGTLKLISQSTSIWVKTLSRISPILLLNILFVTVFYLPAVTFSPSLLEAIKEVVYVKALFILESVSVWASISLALVEIFGFEFSKNALVFAFGPTYTLDNLVFLSPISKSSLFSSILDSSRLLFLGFGFFLVYLSKEPKDMNENQSTKYRMTKDGSVSCLFKGLLGFFVLNIFLFFNILRVYLGSGFFAKVLFRFIVFPACFDLSKWIQTKVLFHLSKEEMDKRLIVNKMCNRLIQFIGRVFISNLSRKGALSFEFITVNFTAAVIEVLSTIFFEYKTRHLYRISKIFSSKFLKIKCVVGKKIAPVTSERVDQKEDVGEANEVKHLEEDPSNEENYVKEAISFRTRYIYDDIVSEIYSIIFAPLLMFFIHRILPDSSFEPIDSFNECLNQIIIQLFFEFTADILALSFELKKRNIKAIDVELWRPMTFPVMFFWSLFCVFNMNRVVASF